MTSRHLRANLAAGAALTGAVAVSRLCAIPGPDKLVHFWVAAAGVAVGRAALAHVGVTHPARWAFSTMVAAGLGLEVIQGAGLFTAVPVLAGDAEMADAVCDVLGAAAGALVSARRGAAIQGDECCTGHLVGHRDALLERGAQTPGGPVAD